MGERLDKFLSSQGMGTRKEVGKRIRKGTVTVNGIPVYDPAFKVEPGIDLVQAAEQLVHYEKYRYVMMNKPAGVLSATEDRRAATVLDLLPEDLRRRGLFPAGRLDKDTTGLLLITDDGGLAHRMLAPKSHVYKLYRAETDRPLVQQDVEAFAKGVTWGQFHYAPAKLHLVEGHPCVGLVEVREGKFHQVKRMFESCGKRVTALHRLRMGGLWLDPDLKPGQCRQISQEEIMQIFQ